MQGKLLLHEHSILGKIRLGHFGDIEICAIVPTFAMIISIER